MKRGILKGARRLFAAGPPAAQAERMPAGAAAVRDGKVPAWAVVLVVVCGFLYLSLADHLPLSLLANASHDDAWFFQRAHALAIGHWFGRFSQMTLIKGPGYSIFLALNAALGLPITLSQALLYLAACALFAHAVFRLGRSAVLALAVFTLALWHPHMLAVRAIRDDIYGAQTLLYLASLIHILLLPLRAPGSRRWAVAGGLAFAWLWFTREEGVWVLPASAILCAAAVWRDRARLRPILMLGGSALASWVVIAGCNFIAYRTVTVVDFKGRPYREALGALQSVRAGEPVAYVPVPAKARERIYAVSPAFASLKPYFEVLGRGWMDPGCQVYPSTCGDYAGGWFIWALRDAAAWAGHYRTPQDAARFYDQITTEVRAACRAGRLECRRGLVSYMPPVTQAQWRQVPSKLGDMAGLLLARSPPPEPGASAGNPAQLEEMWTFEGLPRRVDAPSERVRFLAGWFYDRSGAWLQARCTDADVERVISIAHVASADIADHFKDPAATDRRFSLQLPSSGECRLQLAGAGTGDPSLPYAEAASRAESRLGGGQLYLDSRSVEGAASKVPARRIVGLLAGAYRIVLPLLAVAAAAAYVLHLALWARGRLRPDGYWLLCHMLWLLLACRAAVLLLVDLSSFPAINTLYLSAAFPLFCSALLLTLYLPARAASSPDLTAEQK